MMKLIIYAIFLSLVSGQGYNNPSWVGNRTTVVHLFEWKWSDIAAECERFLGPNGYAGVQVSPPNENAVINEPPRPWWERYQPVSYKLETRSGTEEQFRDMVRRCNSAGVRIIVDAVINHMTHFTTVGVGTGGSAFNSADKSYPGVPYTQNEFHGPAECKTESGDIENHLSAEESRVCQVGGLRDLNQGVDTVRDKLVEYMDRLVSYGVAGFRIDCGKQIYPQDLQVIYDQIRNLPEEHGFPPNARPFVFHEVIILDSAAEEIKAEEYFGIGRATEFKFSVKLGDIVRKNGGRQLKDVFTFEETEGMNPSDYAMIFVDNHDNQRGHGAGGGSVVSHLEPKLYKVATAFMLAWPYAQVKIMSSYVWSGLDEDSWVGPPATNGVIDSPIITPQGTCDGGWICEHRWRQIKHMTAFRNIVQGTEVLDKWENGNQIAFSRGNKGFIVINNGGQDLNISLQTSLPAGTYCDVITGELVDGACTGREIQVALSGRAEFFIPGNDEELVTAIHVQAMATL